MFAAVFAILLAVPGEADLFAAHLDRIDRWRRGDDQALAEMTALTPEQVESAVHAVELMRASCDDTCVRAAVLMHTALGFYFRALEQHPRREAHFRAAERMISLVRASGAAARHDDFERRWRLAIAAQRVVLTEFEEALEILRDLEKEWGKDADVLVARGTLRELLSVYPHDPPVDRTTFTRRDTPPRRPAQERAEAKACYRQAVERDPRHALAHVRYGRLLATGGDVDDAVTVIERGLTLDPSPEVAAFAHLFLGEIAESAGRLEEAEGRYRRAVEADRHLQSARFALCHVLHRLERRVESAQVLDEAMTATRPGDRVDTWAGYEMGVVYGYHHWMAQLRQELR